MSAQVPANDPVDRGGDPGARRGPGAADPGGVTAAPAAPAGPDLAAEHVEPHLLDAEAVYGELDLLRRKLDDQGALLRRNQLALTELAESVGKLVAQQRRRERSFTLSSFVAYLLFTVLLGGGFFMLYRSRAGDLVAARDRAVIDRDASAARVRELADQLDARAQAAAAAHDYWTLLRDGKRSEAIAQYPDVQGAELTPTERELFAEGEKKARAEMVDAGFLAGLDAFRAGKLPDAVTELRRALAYEEEGTRAAQMRYYLGVALVKQDQADDGTHQLELALAGRVDKAGVVDARYWLGVGLEKLGRVDEARAEYDRFATAQPQNPLSVTARRKSAALARMGAPKN
ncbi:MAG: hypothetical protein H6708_34390 [Kofleriaceae bacterium]|nr:hypothetical protein [Myxococcales bacterium]MCB9565504.1 hypothetical protein [Kofleriaceae bacterium]